MGHGVAGVDGEVQQRAFQLIVIGFGQPCRFGQVHFQPDILVHRSPQHVFHAGDEVADIHGCHVERLAAGKSEQALRQGGCTLRRRHRRVDIAIDAVLAPGGQMPLKQVQRTDHARQHIVEIMRNATGQLADGFHFLRLPQRFFRRDKLTGSFLDPLLQTGIEFRQGDGGAHPLDMRPGSFRH